MGIKGKTKFKLVALLVLVTISVFNLAHADNNTTPPPSSGGSGNTITVDGGVEDDCDGTTSDEMDHCNYKHLAVATAVVQAIETAVYGVLTAVCTYACVIQSKSIQADKDAEDKVTDAQAKRQIFTTQINTVKAQVDGLEAPLNGDVQGSKTAMDTAAQTQTEAITHNVSAFCSTCEADSSAYKVDVQQEGINFQTLQTNYKTAKAGVQTVNTTENQEKPIIDQAQTDAQKAHKANISAVCDYVSACQKIVSAEKLNSVGEADQECDPGTDPAPGLSAGVSAAGTGQAAVGAAGAGSQAQTAAQNASGAGGQACTAATTAAGAAESAGMDYKTGITTWKNQVTGVAQTAHTISLAPTRLDPAITTMAQATGTQCVTQCEAQGVGFDSAVCGAACTAWGAGAAACKTTSTKYGAAGGTFSGTANTAAEAVGNLDTPRSNYLAALKTAKEFADNATKMRVLREKTAGLCKTTGSVAFYADLGGGLITTAAGIAILKKIDAGQLIGSLSGPVVGLAMKGLTSSKDPNDVSCPGEPLMDLLQTGLHAYNLTTSIQEATKAIYHHKELQVKVAQHVAQTNVAAASATAGGDQQDGNNTQANAAEPGLLRDLPKKDAEKIKSANVATSNAVAGAGGIVPKVFQAETGHDVDDVKNAILAGQPPGQVVSDMLGANAAEYAPMFKAIDDNMDKILKEAKPELDQMAGLSKKPKQEFESTGHGSRSVASKGPQLPDLGALFGGLLGKKPAPAQQGPKGPPPVKFTQDAKPAEAHGGFHSPDKSLFDIVASRYQILSPKFLAGETVEMSEDREPASGSVPGNIYLKH